MNDERTRLLRVSQPVDLGDNVVTVHVYDLVEGINKYAHPFGLGVYHTGVEVYGYEWAFGGHDIAGQPGIYALRASSLPRTPGERIGTDEQHYVYRASYPIGSTRLSKEEVEDVVRDMGRTTYLGTQYHILQRNCNNFSDEFCARLTGLGAPAWINRIANLGVRLHCLLPAGYLPELIEERGRSAAGRIAGGG